MRGSIVVSRTMRGKYCKLHPHWKLVAQPALMSDVHRMTDLTRAPQWRVSRKRWSLTVQTPVEILCAHRNKGRPQCSVTLKGGVAHIHICVYICTIYVYTCVYVCVQWKDERKE